jgi:hypothetical protein
MKVYILYMMDAQEKFIINEKKDEALGVITTYIAHEI